MRKSCFAFMAAVLVVTGLATAAGAQGFQAVYSKNGNDVWAVGDAGTAWRSFDGGATWLSQTLGAKPLHGVPGLYRIRIGDYRIVYSADRKAPSVTVEKVGHRKEVYRFLGR